jgi:hypothetical protein
MLWKDAQMTTVWERIQALEGQTLYTVGRRKAFNVSEVGENHVTVVPASTGKARRIPRQELARAEAHQLISAAVRPGKLRTAGVSEANPAYVAAIIRAISKPLPQAHGR